MIDLSVVVGSVASERSIRACLTSVLASCAGLNAEIIVVDASTDGTASLVRRLFPSVPRVEVVGALRPSAGTRQAPDLEGARAHRN